MATAQPAGQQRNAWGRDHGNFATVVSMPNGSGNVLPTATVPFNIEAGDHCYLSLSTGQCDYLCISPGTAAGGNAVWVPSSGQGPWSSVLYVDQVRGSDTTGQRGNANRPFATIQAAFNAASASDDIELAPQLFSLTAAITRPATLTAFSIHGFAPQRAGNTTAPLGTMVDATGVDAFDLSVNLGLQKAIFSDFYIRALTAGFAPIKANGAAYAASAFLTRGLDLEQMTLIGNTTGGCLATTYVAALSIGGGSLSSGPLLFTKCGTINMIGVDAAIVGCIVTCDRSDALSLATVLNLRSGTILGGSGASSFITWGGQAAILVDSSSAIGGLKGSGLSVNAAPLTLPSVSVTGHIGGSNSGVVDLASAGSELPDTANTLTVDFRGSDGNSLGANPGVSGPSTLKFKVAGAAANFQTVKLDSTIMLPATTFTADAAIHMTGRGSMWPQMVLTTPGANGDIIPPQLTGTIDLHLGGAVAFTWVQLGYAGLVRTGAACDTAFLTESAAASDPFIAAKATTGLTITSAAVAGDTACNWLAIWK